MSFDADILPAGIDPF